MWCEEFKIKNNLAEISQNFTFPHFPLFEIFALIAYAVTLGSPANKKVDLGNEKFIIPITTYRKVCEMRTWGSRVGKNLQSIGNNWTGSPI